MNDDIGKYLQTCADRKIELCEIRYRSDSVRLSDYSIVGAFVSRIKMCHGWSWYSGRRW